jgi:hypothetical protein
MVKPWQVVTQPWGHRLHGLSEAIYRCSGTKVLFITNSKENARSLIGVPGTGFEVHSQKHKEEQNTITDKKCRGRLSVSFNLLDDQKGWKIIEELSSGRVVVSF